MRPRRAIASSPLAFIDVMACGLGAVMLLLAILDFDKEPIGIASKAPSPVVERQAPKDDGREVEALKKIIKSKEEAIKELTESVSERIIKKAEAEALLSTIDAMAPTEQTEPQSKPSEGSDLPGELVGLSITGKRNVILLDASASMAHEKLVDIIIGISDVSGSYLAKGKKWSQSKRVVSWLIRNAPKDSKIRLLAYSDKVLEINPTWTSPQDAERAFQTQSPVLRPSKGTSLASILEYLVAKSITPSDIYLVTDGLPTLPGKHLNIGSIKGVVCSSLGRRYVSGKCRLTLFGDAVSRFQKHSIAPVNIVLLPLEGDPKAAPAYSMWAARTGGSLLSPADGWPK